MDILDKDGNPVKKSKDAGSNALILGILLVAIGAVLVLANMGLISPLLRRVLVSWQMLLIAIGTIELCRKHYTQGFIIFMIGVFFLMPRLIELVTGNYANGFTRNYWPVFLIIVGLTIIISIFANGKGGCQHGFGAKDHNRQKVNGEIDYDFLFSGAEQVYMDPVFKGGEINVLFGGITLDLRNTSLAEGTTTLKISALFGGVTIIVPAEWNVEVSQKSILGGFADNRSATYSENNSKLVVYAECIFGGGEVK
ncbi:MAG: LiaF-related protein [Bacteroidales bacterium]|nr:LiaF-related protein [Bacteroidales bacterium]MDD3201643.1 LiaF-related protein [Bacteroidales bacterium]